MQLPLCIEASLICRLINFGNFHAFCECHEKGGKLLTSALLDLKLLILKKEKYIFCEISDQPTPKRVTLVRFVGTYI